MNLLELKQLLLNKFDIEEKDIEMKSDTRLKIKDVLICFYDEKNENFYGDLYDWKYNKPFRNQFHIPVNQVGWLIKKLNKLENHIHHIEKNCTNCGKFTIESVYGVCSKHGILNECKYHCNDWEKE